MKQEYPDGESVNPSSDLRQRAEEMLQKQPAELDKIAPKEMKHLLHELQVHQIELELQNEELRRAQQELVVSRDRYFDLYDLAPVGYLTISENGLILEANLTAANLLGLERGHLIKRPVTRFIAREDQDIYYLHRKQLLESGLHQSWDLRMIDKEGTQFWAHLDATAAQDDDGTSLCRLTISNINARKEAEEERANL